MTKVAAEEDRKTVLSDDLALNRQRGLPGQRRPRTAGGLEGGEQAGALLPGTRRSSFRTPC